MLEYLPASAVVADFTSPTTPRRLVTLAPTSEAATVVNAVRTPMGTPFAQNAQLIYILPTSAM